MNPWILATRSQDMGFDTANTGISPTREGKCGQWGSMLEVASPVTIVSQKKAEQRGGQGCTSFAILLFDSRAA